MSTNEQPPVRKCVLTPGSKGYGFNLHGDKNQPGQTISAVDEGSPAALAGLKQGDRLIEVNEENVEDEKHGEVVKKIKKVPNCTTLLVCDPDTLSKLKASNRKCTCDLVGKDAKSVFEEPEASDEAPCAPEPTVNGEAKPEETPEQVVESSPAAAVEAKDESAPPPAQQTEQSEPEDTTTPEEVKELNEILNEQDTTAKPDTQPEPAETTQEPEQTDKTEQEPEPTKPAEIEIPQSQEPEQQPCPEPTPQQEAPKDPKVEMEKARALAKNKRVIVKGDKRSFAEKASEVNKM